MTVIVHTSGYLCDRDSYKKTFRLELNDGATICDLLNELKLDRRKKFAVFIDRKRQKDLGESVVDGTTVEIFSLIGGG